MEWNHEDNSEKWFYPDFGMESFVSVPTKAMIMQKM